LNFHLNIHVFSFKYIYLNAKRNSESIFGAIFHFSFKSYEKNYGEQCIEEEIKSKVGNLKN
jgi:hypothetical protein